MKTTESRILPNAADKAVLKQLASMVVQTCPSLHDSAHTVARELLEKHNLHGLDPDKVYFHRFKAAQSNPHTFTGWEHIREKPYETQTLTQLVIHRFRATDQDNADLLDLWAGFYDVGPVFTDFNQTNEVRLHGRDVLNDFWSIQFSERYNQQLHNFWDKSADDFRTLAKCSFLSKAVQALEHRQLSETDLQAVLDAVAPGLTWPITLAALKTTSHGDASRVRTVDIAGHVATNLLRIVTQDGRQIVYIPGEDPGFQVFKTAADLHWWFMQQLDKEQPRTNLLYHFPLADRHAISEDIPALMSKLVHAWGTADHHLINQKNQVITGDAFTWLRDSTRSAMFAEADLCLTSNGDLRKKLWIGYLSAGLRVFGPMAAVGWPVALPVLGAGIASLGLNIDQAQQGKTPQERKAGVLGAVFAGIFILLDLLAIKGPGPMEEVGEEVEASLAKESAQWRERLEPEEPPESPPVNTVAPGATPVIEPPAPPDVAPRVIPESWQINELLEDDMLGTEPGTYQGIYKLRSEPWYAVMIKGLGYYARLERDVNGPDFWTAIDPSGSPLSKPIPIRLNTAGEWEPMTDLKLAGGTGGLFKKIFRRPPALPPTVQNPLSDYEIPLSERPALDSAASYPPPGRYTFADDAAFVGEDPHASFKAARQRLFRDAATYLNGYTPRPRPPVPQLPANASTSDALRTLLRNDRAIVFGESHASVGSKQLLIDNMAVLAEADVKTIYLEHLLTDFHQAALDVFHETGFMSEKLRRYLQNLDFGHVTDRLGQYNFLELVKAAQANKIRIQSLDCMASYRLQGLTAPSVEGQQLANNAPRQAMMNYYASTVIRADQAARGAHKWVALVGNTHASNFKGIAGLDEIEEAFSVRVKDVPPGQPGRFRPDPGIEPTTDHSGLKSDLLFETPIPAQPNTLQEYSRLLQKPGMFTIKQLPNSHTLVHRSRAGDLVDTAIRHNAGQFFIEQPKWPTIDGQRFDSLKQLVIALEQTGMTLADKPRHL
ncbi:membrane-targeted effector domain-containing toxin [Pseudomonas sp. R5-89-07]|uniref:membrane-targeted effector domain-containing toxin n=1 Tax=Pseudomonas sp. R5-89-07 TaxID=658644 RepID=UPI000F6CEDB4|nr:membrane-targeted effector domain-containing toxin [Pseudomonas sp. R5-89-07]AZF07198.1 hypothetical protein C4J94_4460 [Pseudomonas sp. R5-89-07]